eukprot:CAMPEP_0206568974 /NCGR_PEP_ID=MMETSP0325_2-20121206/26157_1 /ASSEMBLY_ACC=CAM_ASM_000347 /TAXON_ID=2866 /ORGANISM="Crypthecodinium cohnii, Strain Seligo" /LENGTH=478 /DNA_ID=CAMNT_0054072465 /DNA_START=183 /DNA_END=1619 /DNA_ORIENTATION=-
MMFLGRASFAVMKATDTSLLGYTGKEYLEAVALGDLWNSATGVFIFSSTLSLFCSNAMGSDNLEMIGVWLQVAYSVLAVVCIFVAICWSVTGPLLKALGSDHQLADDAQYFALVLMLCLPVRIAFSQLSIAFNSQKVVKPGSIVASISMCLNLIFGMLLVRGIPFRASGFEGYGFAACPWVTTGVEYAQFLLMWTWTVKIQKLHLTWWPGWSCRHVTKDRVWMFLVQYVPQTLSSASDFWRVTVLGTIATSMGEENVAVFNASYRICWIVLIFSSCIGQAMSIRIGISLGAGKPREARRHAEVGIAMALTVLCLLCLSLIAAPQLWGRIFTNDRTILEMFENSRLELMAFVGFMNFAVVLEKIPFAVGRPRVAFWMGVVGSWCGQVPGALLAVNYWRRDLSGLYLGSAAGYALLCVLLIISCTRFDWHALAAEAEARSKAAASPTAAGTASLQPVQASTAAPPPSTSESAGARPSQRD